ncbi:glycoside hydrolase family 108 protein [Pseudidiomarina aestuarii]|uniref:glycoside hydrolase family 108 protein n=1 Tax=Pseudidiomarina aestuarii TaxID=624146 RepID=UPI003A9710C2
MMRSYDKNFLFAMQFVAFWEGGEVNDPNDPGGHTNYGVTQKTLDIARPKFSAAGLPASVSDLTESHCHFIYYNLYWEPLRCSSFPCELALLIFDAAVNQGQSDAAKFLQRVVGAHVDGILGSKTVATTVQVMSTRGLRYILQQYSAERAYDYALNSNIIERFGRGWYRRLFACYSAALDT